MGTKKIVIILGVVILIIMGLFYAYLNALSSIWALNPPDERPFFVTTKPIVINNMLLPKGAKITYKKSYFWEKYEQKKILKEKDIIEVSFDKGTIMNWGGVPITSINKFYNSKMKGFTVYADFSRIDKNKETQFSNLWQSCSNSLGITVANTKDWSFNKKNILNIESCGVNYQRYFKEDLKQQKFLDNLYDELMKIRN